MSTPLTQNIEVVNTLGLHARATAKLVKLATQFQSEISLSYNGETVSAKSMMGVLMLAAGKGAILTLTVSGPDQDQAFTDLKAIFEAGFGEK